MIITGEKMDLLRKIIKMKRSLKEGEYIHVILPYEHGVYIGKDDKLIPYWTHKYFVVKRNNIETIVPVKKIIMIQGGKIYE